MEKDYYVKYVKMEKDSSWKIYRYALGYYSENNPNYVYWVSRSAEDFKKLYWDLDLNRFVWQKIKVKSEVILK